MCIDTISFLNDSGQVLFDSTEYNVALLDTLSVTSSGDSIFTINLVTEKDTIGFWEEFWKNALTIFLALIAGVVALLQVKSNIISSSRIKWIEDLKSDLSELYSETIDTVYYFTLSQLKSGSENQNAKDKYNECHTKFNILSNRIKMQLNSSEPDHKKIEGLIDEIDGMLDANAIVNSSQQVVEGKLKEIVSASKVIFKKEWDKSKSLFKYW